MSSRAALLLCLPTLLCACQDTQARQQNARLEQRVTALEAQVQELRAARPHAPTVQNVTAVTVQAAAQSCAVELARTLELYRQDSLEHRYPTHAEMEFPDACQNQQVKWQTLTTQAFAFQVIARDGQVLAEQQGP